MELRRLSIFLAFLLVAAFTQCSEARHSLRRRGADVENRSKDYLNDEGNEEAQNDETGNDAEEEEEEVVGVIRTLPVDYRVTEGKNVRLECQVEPKDNPAVVIMWKKDGEDYFFGTIRQNAPTRFTLDTTDMLIYNISKTDMGKYTCSIAQANPVSVTHTVVVHPAQEAPRIIRFTATDNGNVKEGQPLLFTCDVTGFPRPEIQWTRDRGYGNERLSEGDGKFSDHTFYIASATKEISGVYYCYAMSPVGTTASNVTVTVIAKPKSPQVLVHRPVVNSDIGTEAQLSCSVHEETSPHIRWYKDGRLIEDTSSGFTIDTSGTRSTLTITPRNDEDFGTFTCEASNHYGKHSQSIDLVQRPVIEDLDSEGPKLTWKVHSHQPLEDIEVQLKSVNSDDDWTVIKVPLPQSEMGKHEYELVYIIDDKKLEGKYQAFVKAKNNKDWSRTSDPTEIEIEHQEPLIQTASVTRGNAAHSIRPTSTILATLLMYLLVRMF